MNLPVKDYIIGGAVIAVLAIVGTLIHEKSHDKQLEAQKIVADSAHKTDSLSGIQKEKARIQADLRADSIKKVGERQVAKAAALQAHTDSAAKAASEERDIATKLLADSLATVVQLRTELTKLVSTSLADATAATKQHTEDQKAIVDLTASVSSQKSAKESAIDEAHVNLKRAVDAEKQRDIAKGLQPSFFQRHISVALGYAAISNGGKIVSGPGASVGWRVWP